MGNVLIHSLILLVSLLLLFDGFLLLLSPRRHRDFLNWWGGWPRINLTSPPKRTFGSLVAGVGFLAMGAAAAYASISGLARSLALNPRKILAPAGASLPGGFWTLLLFAILMVLLGVCALASPQSLLRWSLRGMPQQIITESTLVRWRAFARILGAAFVLAGVGLAVVLLKGA